MIQIIQQAPANIQTFILQSNHNHQMLYDYFHTCNTKQTTENEYYDVKISLLLDHKRLFINFFVQIKRNVSAGHTDQFILHSKKKFSFTSDGNATDVGDLLDSKYHTGGSQV